MSDLISREKAIETLKEYEAVEFDFFTKTGPVSMMIVSTITNCIEAIAKLPSEEPERKKGKWIEINGTSSFMWLRCSECGYGVNYRTNFCPNCGADMRGNE